MHIACDQTGRHLVGRYVVESISHGASATRHSDGGESVSGTAAHQMHSAWSTTIPLGMLASQNRISKISIQSLQFETTKQCNSKQYWCYGNICVSIVHSRRRYYEYTHTLQIQTSRTSKALHTLINAITPASRDIIISTWSTRRRPAGRIGRTRRLILGIAVGGVRTTTTAGCSECGRDADVS